MTVSFFDPLPPEPTEPDENEDTGWRPPVWDRPSVGTLGVTDAHAIRDAAARAIVLWE